MDELVNLVSVFVSSDIGCSSIVIEDLFRLCLSLLFDPLNAEGF